MISPPAEDLEALPTATAQLEWVPELLAPAGNWECAKAAVGKRRGRHLLRPEPVQRPDAGRQLHRGRPARADGVSPPARRARLRDVQHAHFSRTNLPAAEAYLRAIIAAGVDAAIVQDIGICRLIRRLSPDFPIHGSTQMTVTSAAGAEFVRALGCQLVVLARECSIREIVAKFARNWRRGTPGVDPAGGVRPRRALRGVFGPVSDERGVGRTLGQPG